MVPYTALGVYTAHSGTGVNTLLLLTRLVRRTIGVKETLRPTIGRRAKHSRPAGTVTSVTIAPGWIAVFAAGVRLAGVGRHDRLNNLWLQTAFCEGIADVSSVACACWNVASNLADGVDSTGSRARINTLVSLTCFVRRTVRVDHTFWSACNIWVSEVFWNTLASCGSTPPLANRIGSTGRGVAGVHRLSNRRPSGSPVADTERIAFKARLTDAAGPMVTHLAVGVGAAHPGTWVNTLVGDTGQVDGAVRVEGTLWLALCVRIPKHARDAGTGGSEVALSAIGIDSAGGRIAGINNFRFGRRG